jgi:hypothetical protein
VRAVALVPQAPPDRGRLLDADQVAVEVFSGQVTPHWVKRNLRAGRVKIGARTVRWWEHEARGWLNRQTEQGT